MSLKASFNRWKKIILDLKKNESKFELIETNFSSIFSDKYSEMKDDIEYKTMLKNKEYKVSSQHGEDGLLLFIFSQIGTTNKTFIEFGIGNGSECNSANLIRNFGWNGLLIEGNKKGTDNAKKLFSNQIEKQKLKVSTNFITSENINSIFSDNHLTGEIDLLSIDIDGNDYWIWETINTVNPRVVAIEYNASLGHSKSLSTVYKSDFMRFNEHPSGLYHGASLEAFRKLGNKLGYKLIGCSSDGVNAFFVRNDINLGYLQEVTSEYAFYPHAKRMKTSTLKEQYDQIAHLKFENI